MRHWYDTFFTELPNAFWRAAVTDEYTTAEVDFLVRATGLPSGAHVLDLPCGSGRHSLALARRGFRVTGIDVSQEAITFARHSTHAETVDFRVGDMAAVPQDLHADLAICMGNSFGYLDHDGTRQYLADLANVVQPGGHLVLDYGFVAESLLPGLHLEEPPMTIGGIEATSINEYDATNSRWLTTFTFRRGAEEHHGTSVQHVYTAAEVVRLVREAGFTGTDLYGDPDGTPFGLGSPRLLLVARR
ncbi:class I SAM-dependent methyltransferase [Dactylosporangium sp. CS-047395]|uniref:class I SAM-dependent methyltransferase n=1 Tax=Dactylosporangium sp. CS-047395 TaxID=3239936 RepID=UPI003D8E8B26